MTFDNNFTSSWTKRTRAVQLCNWKYEMYEQSSGKSKLDNGGTYDNCAHNYDVSRRIRVGSGGVLVDRWLETGRGHPYVYGELMVSHGLSPRGESPKTRVGHAEPAKGDGLM